MKITVIPTSGQRLEIETGALTYGELKPVLAQHNVDIANKNLIVGSTKMQLSLDVAVLPTEDFKLFIVPMQTKSGAGYLESLSEELKNLEKRVAALERLNSTKVVTSEITDEEARELSEITAMCGISSLLAPAQEEDEDDDYDEID